MLSGPGPPSATSLPEPPSTISDPSPPRTPSFPGPPTRFLSPPRARRSLPPRTQSLPSSPSRLSLPPRPKRASLPPLPKRLSAPLVPLRVSGPGPPILVTAQATPLATNSVRAMVATINKARLIIRPFSIAYPNVGEEADASGRNRQAHPDHTTPSSPTFGGRCSTAGYTTGSPRPQVPTFAETWFVASDRSYWEAPYQDRASWHITQTAYLCSCLWLLAHSKLLRTPLGRTSENSPSETV